MTAPTDSRYGHALDPTGLTRLKADLKAPTPETAKAVAKQFEGLFIQQMLKAMRAATPGDEMFGGQAETQYRELFDQQLGANLAQGRGLGLAPMIERQLLAGIGQAPAPTPVNTSVKAYRGAQPMALPANAAPVGKPAAPAVGAKSAGWDSPDEFVKGVWRSAEKAAKKLGVATRALVAQAALETGWGQRVIRKGDGESSFNLFGIKSHGWGGDSVKVPTLEFRGGVAAKELASFRAYGSLDECFEDYARFLQNNPRYREALEAGEDPEAFAQALQAAGYATDPEYADKISRILKSPALGAALKNPDERPTT